MVGIRQPGNVRLGNGHIDDWALVGPVYTWMVNEQLHDDNGWCDGRDKDDQGGNGMNLNCVEDVMVLR